MFEQAGRLHRLQAGQDNDERLQAITAWLCAVGTFPAVWQSAEWRDFLEEDSLLISAAQSDGVEQRCMRVCNAVEAPDGHHRYTTAVFPRDGSQLFSVTRVPNVSTGQLLQFASDGAMHHVAVPAYVEEGGTFVAAAPAADGPCVLVPKRYSEWLTLDLRLSGWANANRRGDSNGMHDHVDQVHAAGWISTRWDPLGPPWNPL